MRAFKLGLATTSVSPELVSARYLARTPASRQHLVKALVFLSRTQIFYLVIGVVDSVFLVSGKKSRTSLASRKKDSVTKAHYSLAILVPH